MGPALNRPSTQLQGLKLHKMSHIDKALARGAHVSYARFSPRIALTTPSRPPTPKPSHHAKSSTSASRALPHCQTCRVHFPPKPLPPNLPYQCIIILCIIVYSSHSPPHPTHLPHYLYFLVLCVFVSAVPLCNGAQTRHECPYLSPVSPYALLPLPHPMP